MTKKDKEMQVVQETLESDPVEYFSKLIKPDFALDWKSFYRDKRDEQRLEEYLKKEIQTAFSEGYAVLSSILSRNLQSEILIKTKCLELLKTDSDLISEIGRKPIMLKLVPEQFRNPLPIHDYNGCLVPAAKRGKVLAAKVATAGEIDIASQGGGERAELLRDTKYLAPQFIANQAKAKTIYQFKNAPYYCEEIGESPKLFKLDEAISVLTRYGWGISISVLGKEKTTLWFVQEVV